MWCFSQDIIRCIGCEMPDPSAWNHTLEAITTKPFSVIKTARRHIVPLVSSRKSLKILPWRKVPEARVATLMPDPMRKDAGYLHGVERGQEYLIAGSVDGVQRTW